jgi:fructosamine-3-kinase
MSTLEEKIKALFISDDIRVIHINPASYHTNEVFEVSSKEGSYIVKVPKSLNDPHNTFWKGVEQLFSLNLIESIKNQESISQHLKQHGAIDVPGIIKADASHGNPLGKPYVVLEKMHGEQIIQGSDLEERVMQEEGCVYQLGTHVGSLHRQKIEYFGTLNQKKYPLKEFPARLSQTISKLGASKQALQDPGVQERLSHYVQKALNMPPPEHCSIIMLDLWPNQFLSMQGRLSACIDIEACVIGPLALELTLIELWMSHLGRFKEGYFSVNPHWPEEMENTREIYRFFLFLLYGCPEKGLGACLYSDVKFPTGEGEHKRLLAPRLRPRPPGFPGFKR